MSSKQHVGKLADSIGEGEGDEAREMARAQAQALAKLAKPVDRPRGPRMDLGDGDPCPDGHGKMYVYGKRQWCPHSDHDGVLRDGIRTERTRCWFPLWMEEEAKAS